MKTMRSYRGAALAALLSLAFASPGSAQFDRVRRAASGAAAQSINPARLLEAPPPITTSLADARWAVDSLDSHSPDSGSFKLLTELQRTPNGGFVLQPGHWAMQDQSYCLKAGTHGPGGGDGYLYAPPRGPAEQAVVSILRNSVQHPDIAQRDIQVLLWAIIAHAKFEDLPAGMKATASRLLTPQQIATLNRSALDLIPEGMLEQTLASVPEPAKTILRAEAQLRSMVTSANNTYDDLERVAVLAGVVPRGQGSRDVPSGRWSLHPDGYYVRYIPSGYSSTRTEIWVPEGSPAVGKEYDPALHIAVPGNTSRQRLIQSARPRS